MISPAWFEYATDESKSWHEKFAKQMKIFDTLHEEEKAKKCITREGGKASQEATAVNEIGFSCMAAPVSHDLMLYRQTVSILALKPRIL